MNEIQIFRNEEFGEIRTIEIEGQIYFVGVDVAKALGYKNTKDAIINHVRKEDRMVLTKTAYQELTKSQNVNLKNFPNRGLVIINESGLYSLILSSKLDRAKEFKYWVTSEVLPEIRRNGMYGKASFEEMLHKLLNEKLKDIIKEAIDEKSENIIDRTVDKTVKAVSPLLTLPTSEKEVKTIKEAYKYSSSKMMRLSPDIREQVDNMIISGEYSCQKIADFIEDNTGIEISYMTVSRYIKKYFTLK